MSLEGNSVLSISTVHRSAHSKLTLHLLGALCAIIAGALLFFASRRLAWGRDQAYSDWPLWLIAALPYVIYFAAIWSAAIRFADFVKKSDFLPIWTVSLLAFVVMRTSALSRLYEPGIYDNTVVGIARYSIISAVYICFAFLTVTAWRLLFDRHIEYMGTVVGSIAARLAGIVVAFVLFCAGVFLIWPTS
jgi:hypothetical protein